MACGRIRRMEITLNSPLDMHLHLRDGDMLKLTAPLSADFAGAVIMPNLVPPVTQPEQMQQYANIKLESNYCMVHEHIPAENLPILYYVGDGPYMVLATKKSQE